MSYWSKLPSSLLSEPQKDALHDLEAQFSLDKPLMLKTLDQFLFEFNEGLGRQATKDEADTFLPMMWALCRDIVCYT
jgi:hypothetical protein